MTNSTEPTFSEDDDTTGEEMEEERLTEIGDATRSGEELRERLDENTAASPADSVGDVDAAWEDVNVSGSESVFGDNPTPDQSDVEQNAHAMGINFEDNEPLDFVRKMEKRDEDRYDLNEDSKGEGDTI